MTVTTLAPTASDPAELLEACIQLLKDTAQVETITTLEILHTGTIEALQSRRGTVSMSAVRECIEDALGAIDDYARTVGHALTVSGSDYVLIEYTR